jgi:hypothetical protein
MTFVTWLLRLGAGRATSNAARVLDARRRAEAEVEAVANRLVDRLRPAA